MSVRAVAALLAVASGCGRLGFAPIAGDAGGDSGDSTPPISLELPAGGRTWIGLNVLPAEDGYFASSIAFIGARAFVGTYRRVLVADPPYTTWTPHQIMGANREVFAVAVTGGKLWAGTEDGLFVSADQAMTFQAVPQVSVLVEALLVLPDGGLAAATGGGTWLSDAATATWALRGPAEYTYKHALIPGGLVAATEDGAFVSRDRGLTWALAPGSETYTVPSAIYDRGTGELVIGTIGAGLVRVPLPP
ncbi:MAG: hypothetical protein H0T46_31915 [Deltaproteobacteria bacterium]|nr:hypothetical protein [Deltaproteobacteria bacterium]